MNFRNEFERESQHLPVPDTDIATIITTARRRTRRRRVAASTLAMVALIVGTAVGIQQLSGVRTTNPNLTPAPAPAVSPDGGTATTTTYPTRVGRYVLPSSSNAVHIDTAVSAQLAPANVTWTVVKANTPEALSVRFDSSQRYALATLPGSSAGLFEQVNGTWNQVKFNTTNLKPMVSGDTVYGIGTASATGGLSQGSFGTFDIASATWRLHELPEQIRPYQSENVDSFLSVALTPIDGGVLAAVQTQAMPSSSVFPGIDAPSPWWVKDNQLHTYVDCDQDKIYGYLTTRTTYTEADYDRIYRENCTEKTLDSAQIGLSQADLDALSRSYEDSLWKITPDSMVPFDTPGLSLADATVSLDGGSMEVSWSDGKSELYTIGSDGSLTRIFADLPQDPWQSVRVGLAPGPEAQPVWGGLGHYLLTQQPGEPTRATDLFSIVGAPDRLNPALNVYRVARTGSLTLAYGDLQYDPPGTLTEPTTVTDSGYSLEMSPDGYRVIDLSTGVEPMAGYELSTATGKVVVSIYPDGVVPTTVSGVAIENTGDPSLSGTAGPASTGAVSTTVVYSSTDPAAPPATSDSVIVDGGSPLSSTSGDKAVAPTSTTTYPAGGNTEATLPPMQNVATFDIDWATVPGLSTVTRQLLFTSVDGVNVAVSDLDAIVRDAVGLERSEQVSVEDVQTTDEGRIMLNVQKISMSTGEVEDLLVIGTPN